MGFGGFGDGPGGAAGNGDVGDSVGNDGGPGQGYGGGGGDDSAGPFGRANPELAMASRAKGRSEVEAAHGEGQQARGIVDFALGLLTMANPLVGVVSWGATELYGMVNASNATTATDIAKAGGFSKGPQASQVEGLAKAGLSLASLFGLSPSVAKVGKTAVDMATLSHTGPKSKAKAGAQYGRGDSAATLGQFTDVQSVKATLTGLNLTATDDQLTTLTNDYNKRNNSKTPGLFQKSRALTTRASRYDYLRSGWKV